MRPLRDLRVLAVTVFLAGPFLSMTLARLGAEVIKVELPGRGDPVRGNGPFAGPEGIVAEPPGADYIATRFLKRSQGVKSVTLDLKNARGRELFLRMAEQSDIVLENLAPGAMTRLGLGYEEVAAANPGVIYASISGYGQTGPYAGQPAHDPQIQGMSGLMDINGEPEGPPTRVGFYIGDLVTPMFAATAILSALRERDRTGRGAYLDVSMMDTLAALMLMENLEEDIAAGAPLRTGNNSRSGPTGQYQARDGAVIITAASDDQWRRLCDAIGAPELVGDVRFARYQVRSENAGCGPRRRAGTDWGDDAGGGAGVSGGGGCSVRARPHSGGDTGRPAFPGTGDAAADAERRGGGGNCGGGRRWHRRRQWRCWRRWWSGSPFCLTGGRCRMWRGRRRWGSITRACWGSCAGWMRGSWSGCGRTGWSSSTRRMLCVSALLR